MTVATCTASRTKIIKLALAILFLAAGTAMAMPQWLFASSSGAANTAAAPAFSPTGFTSPGHGSQVVSVSTSTAGANIRYTVNGIAPTYSTGNLVSASSFNVTAPPSSDTIYQAIAFIPGDPTSVSSVTTSEYDFSSG